MTGDGRRAGHGPVFVLSRDQQPVADASPGRRASVPAARGDRFLAPHPYRAGARLGTIL